MRHIDLSIIIINYKTAKLVKDCLLSIDSQGMACEVVIVDNDSGEQDRDILSHISKTYNFVKIIFNNINLGFSKANNQALAITSGHYVLFLNPDTFLFDSCLKLILDFFKKSYGIGAVTPKLWIDKEKTFMMPPADMPSIYKKISATLFTSLYRGYWFNRAISFWKSKNPIEVEAISGAFILAKRSFIEKIGVFDERFPLYFEDSDLCLRIKKTGAKLFCFPQAEAVHYYNQSAKQSQNAMEKFLLSEQIFMSKHYPSQLNKFFTNFFKHKTYRQDIYSAESSFQSIDFFLPLNTSDGTYLLFSPLSELIPCAAHKINNNFFSFNNDFIEKLSIGTYFLAVIDDRGKILKKYFLEKQ